MEDWRTPGKVVPRITTPWLVVAVASHHEPGPSSGRHGGVIVGHHLVDALRGGQREELLDLGGAHHPIAAGAVLEGDLEKAVQGIDAADGEHLALRVERRERMDHPALDRLLVAVRIDMTKG